MAEVGEAIGGAAARILQTKTWNLLAVAVAAVGTIETVLTWVNYRNTSSVGWYAVVVLLLVALFMLLTLQVIRRTNAQARKVRNQMGNYLLQIPSDGEETFYLSWVFELLKQGRKPGRPPIFITADFAEKSFKGDSSQRGLSSALGILEKMKAFGDRHFDGMFVILHNPESPDVQRQLRRYHKVFNSNVVLLDIKIDESKIDLRSYPLIDFVGSDEVRGGKLAAFLAYDYLTRFVEKPKDNIYRVLLLESYENVGSYERWDERRITSFKEELQNRLNPRSEKVTFHAIGGLQYNRARTREILENSPENNDKKGSSWLQDWDLIFAANDDIALGARDVLIRSHQECPQECKNSIAGHPSFSHQGPRIIGYDGSENFKQAALDDDAEWLLGTVDVQLEIQAEKALDQMEALRSASRLKKILDRLSSISWIDLIFKSRKDSLEVGSQATPNQDGSSDAQSEETPPWSYKLRRPKLVEPILKISPYLKNPLLTDELARDHLADPLFDYRVIARSELKK